MKKRSIIDRGGKNSSMYTYLINSHDSIRPPMASLMASLPPTIFKRSEVKGENPSPLPRNSLEERSRSTMLLRSPSSLLAWLLLASDLLFTANSSVLYVQERASTMNSESFCAKPVDPSLEGDEYDYTQFDSTLLAISPDMAANGHVSAHPPILHSLYAQPLMLNRNQLRQAASSPGDGIMIQRFAEKLVSGKPVTVVVLGASISAGHGVFHLANSWPARLFQYISSVFPNKEHRLLNHAIPATTSGFVAPCIHTMVPQDSVDLILLEYTLNDQYDEIDRRHDTQQDHDSGMDVPARRIMERIIRNLLTLPSSPAIICIHTWGGPSPEPFYTDSIFRHFYTMIMQHYGVPTLSMLDALRELVRDDIILTRKIWPGEGNPHPNCVGMRYIADMVIGFLRDELATAAWRQHHHLHGQLDQVLPSVAHSSVTLPRPLFVGNTGESRTLCLLENQIQHYAARAEGFAWINEGSEGQPKYGWISKEAGSKIEFKLPLEAVKYNGVDLVVGVGMLISWSPDMGIAQLTCTHGCMCDPVEFSGFFRERDTSMTYWRYHHAKAEPGSLECVIRVTGLQRQESKGQKVKTSSLSVSGELGILEYGTTWIESQL